MEVDQDHEIKQRASKLYFRALGNSLKIKKHASPTEIINGIYLGSRFDGSSLAKMTKLNIERVINIGQKIKYPKTMKKIFYIKGRDIPSFPIRNYFHQTFDFIEDSLSNGQPIFIHCRAGISRSATICIAYLMKKKAISAEKAIAYVQERRPRVLPNLGFVKQLLYFEKELGLNV